MGANAGALHARSRGRLSDEIEPKRLARLGYLRLDEIEAAARSLPHRSKYLLMVAGFMRRLFELHLDLVDEVQRELDPADGAQRAG